MLHNPLLIVCERLLQRLFSSRCCITFAMFTQNLCQLAQLRAVRPTRMLARVCDSSCDSTPGVAANAPTVASSRLCQSRLSRAKMSPKGAFAETG
jgi:hypothetical protein